MLLEILLRGICCAISTALSIMHEILLPGVCHLVSPAESLLHGSLLLSICCLVICRSVHAARYLLRGTLPYDYCSLAPAAL